MSVTAIIVDGSDRAQVGGTVVIPAQRIERRGRSWLAVGMGLLTAIIAIGATGPQRTPVEPSAVPGRGPMGIGNTNHAHLRAPTLPDWRLVWTPWREWVDPATGMTVRSPRDDDGLVRHLLDRPGEGHPA